MCKKTIVITVLGVLALVVLGVATFNLLVVPILYQSYEISINRDAESPAEEKAITAAESVNYSDATKLERFNGPSSPEDYLKPKTYLAYTFANYIDKETLRYYQDRYDSLYGRGAPRVIEYTYAANVSEYNSFQIYNSPAPVGVAWHNNTVVLAGSTSNSTVLSKCGVNQFYIRNQTGYTSAPAWDYDYNFTDCYVVRMTLEYNEVYAPTAAFFASVKQIVVMDRDLAPLLIGVSAGGAVA